jgi:hypothetical protein
MSRLSLIAIYFLVTAILMGFFPLTTRAETDPSEEHRQFEAIQVLQERIDETEQTWAEVHDAPKPEEKKIETYEKLIARLESLLESDSSYAKYAEPAVWIGILQASIAESKDKIGGLTSLSAYLSIKKAQTTLTESLKKNSRALYGTAYLNLGVLFSEVPPVNYEKAKQMFAKAANITENSIDYNVLYGKFLKDKMNDGETAKSYLKKALCIKLRPKQQTADSKLQLQAISLLRELGINAQISCDKIMEPPNQTIAPIGEDAKPETSNEAIQ